MGGDGRALQQRALNPGAPARLGGPTVGEDYRYTIDVDGTPVGDVFIAIRSGGVADRALYEAKSAGRNRVVVVDTAAPQPA